MEEEEEEEGEEEEGSEAAPEDCLPPIEDEDEGVDDFRDPSSPQATRDMSEGEEDVGRGANSDFSNDA